MSTPMERAMVLLRAAADLMAKRGKPDAAEQAWRWQATHLLAEATSNRSAIETIDLYGEEGWRAFIAENEGLELLDEAAAIRAAKTNAGWTVGGGAAPLFCIRLHPARAA